MDLYVIRGLHLQLQSKLKAQEQLRDRAWKNHEAQFQKNCAALIHEGDTLVLADDHS